jgi:hypothetical protein
MRAMTGAAVVALVLLVGCRETGTGTSTAEDLSGVAIGLERTPCFGTCPVYSVTIHGDGRVEYEGRNFVAVEGQQAGQADPQAVQSLLAEFDRIGFESLEERYEDPVTDIPSTVLSLTRGGETKTVTLYAVDLSQPPRQALADLAQRIDEVAGTERWVGSEPR